MAKHVAAAVGGPSLAPHGTSWQVFRAPRHLRAGSRGIIAADADRSHPGGAPPPLFFIRGGLGPDRSRRQLAAGLRSHHPPPDGMLHIFRVR